MEARPSLSAIALAQLAADGLEFVTWLEPSTTTPSARRAPKPVTWTIDGHTYTFSSEVVACNPPAKPEPSPGVDAFVEKLREAIDDHLAEKARNMFA